MSRTEVLPKKGFVYWARKNPGGALGSLVMLALMVYGIVSMMEWAVFKATWFAASGSEVQDGGAGWAFIGNKILLFIFGFYPSDSWWRIGLLLVLLAASIVPFTLKGFRHKPLWFLILLVLAPMLVAYLAGGGPGLVARSTNDLGGLSLTLILSYLGLLLSFPLGIVLALGRQSKLPVVRQFSVAYIEFFRGIPLITILFLSSVAVPFFLPNGVSLDKLVRVTLGLVVFQSAYLAEVIRGGLQAIPRGQYEAADSLGLSYPLKNYLVILPQALRHTVANIGGISISFIKDTTLVLIIGMFDLLGIVHPLANDPQWLGFAPEGLLFAGLVYWLICYSVSRISLHLEKHFTDDPNKGDKHGSVQN